ncbi:MAG TPA: hypothetical protein ENJ97_02385 [Planctomycetes bacterium]|nr:hypothetical protein [Planctomycetota bacterium]
MPDLVKRTLLALVGGTALQKVLLFGVSVLLARALGVAGLGNYAFGVQVGLLLALFAEAGVKVVAAREAAARPGEALAWVRASLRARLLLSGLFFGLFVPGVLLAGWKPAFLLVCGGVVFPSAFDMKGLADAMGKASLEVLWEGAALLVQLALVVLLCLGGTADLLPFALAWLAGRSAYALLAFFWIARQGPAGKRIPAAGLLKSGGLISAAVFLNTLVRSLDVILLKLMAGPYPAGLYAAARKLAAAAEAPLALLGRLFRPHLDRAAAAGDREATLERVLRSQAFLVLPVAAGGWLTAGPLLAGLFGDGFAGADWTLKWLLVVMVLTGVGSAFGNTLFASRKHFYYVLPLALATLLNLGLTLALIPAWGSSGAALATALSLALAVPLSVFFLAREGCKVSPGKVFLRPLLAAAAVGGTVWVLRLGGNVFLQVGAGALAWAAAVWVLEFRGRWRLLGRGLQEGSGFTLEEGRHGA